MKRIWNFIKDERGLETSEYAVMGALIVIATIAAITLMRDAIAAAFTRIAGVVTAAGN